MNNGQHNLNAALSWHKSLKLAPKCHKHAVKHVCGYLEAVGQVALGHPMDVRQAKIWGNTWTTSACAEEEGRKEISGQRRAARGAYWAQNREGASLSGEGQIPVLGSSGVTLPQ